MVSSNQKRFQLCFVRSSPRGTSEPRVFHQNENPARVRVRGGSREPSFGDVRRAFCYGGLRFANSRARPKFLTGTGLSVLVGRHGAMNPTERVRCPGARLIQKNEARTACLCRPHGTSCCGIFVTLGEYFCPITLLGDFPVRMSQLEHVGGRAYGCRDDSIDCDSGVRCRFCAGPLGHQAKPLRRCEIEEGTVSDFTSAPEPGVLVGHDAP